MGDLFKTSAPGRIFCTVGLSPSGNVLQRGRNPMYRAQRMKRLKLDWGLELLSAPRDWRYWPPDRRRQVLFVRFGPRQLDDDNLKAGLKPLRDALHEIGMTLDDSDRYALFDYQQQKGQPYRVEVTVTLLDEPCEPTPKKLERWCRAVGREMPRG